MQENGYARKSMYNKKANLLNSVVLIQVLDKIDGIHKVLIEGSVYQASLPVNVNVGESVLAKVKSLYPFVLQLDNLFEESELTVQVLSSLKEKLEVFSGINSEILLKTLIENNQPVIKSRFLRLIKISERASIKFDDPKNKILPLLFWEQANFADLSDRNINYFNYSIDELQNKIFDVVISLKNKSGNTESITELLEIIFPAKLSGKAGLIDKNKKIAGFDSKFYSWIEQNIDSVDEDTIEVLKLLLIYLFQKKFYKRTGFSPEFLITENEPFEMVQFAVKKRINGSINEMFAVNFSYGSDDETPVNTELLINGQMSNLHFNDAILTGYPIHTLLKELPYKIKNNLDLAVKVMFKNHVEFEASSFKGINATV